MRKCAFVLLFITVLCTSVSAQIVVPIYNESSFLTGLTIPFHFAKGSADDLMSVSIDRISEGADCRAAVDFFNKENFLLRCRTPAEVILRLQYRIAGTNESTTYGPIVIRSAKTGYREPSSLTDPPQTLDPSGREGRELVKNLCVQCHISTTTYGNLEYADLAKLISAMARPPMVGRADGGQLKKIEVFLKKIELYGGWP